MKNLNRTNPIPLAQSPTGRGVAKTGSRYPLLRHLGLAKRRPYRMRHTAATLWLESGEAPEWIARQLGHANTQMLFTTYSRYVPNLTRRDGSAFERLLASRFSEGAVQAPVRPACGDRAANEEAVPTAQPPPARRGPLPLQRAA